MLAIYRAIKHWSKLIGGSKIFIYTDSRNNIYDKFDYNKRTNRWKAELSIFDITYKHISGSDNTVADRLSRLNAISKKNASKQHVKLNSEKQNLTGENTKIPILNCL
ncbi:Transposon Ty3-I Gag-Pol polyprotein [Dictyocoela muelleri]|nr:Transposon Ty3-I Gag-Pol polyprotein [Dictyocoela muelleri]